MICHLAVQIDVRVSVTDPARDAQVNVVGMINVLEAARTVGARVVFASSGGALYGRDAAIPSPEDVLTLPESPYGVAKLCAEHYIGLYTGCSAPSTACCGSPTFTARARIRPVKPE